MKEPDYWQNFYIKRGIAKGPVNGEQYFVEDNVNENLELITVPESWVCRWCAKEDIGVKDFDLTKWKIQTTKLYNKVAKDLLLGLNVSIEYTTITKLLEKPLSNSSTDDVILARTVMKKLEEVNGNVLVGNAMLKGRLIR